MSAFGRKGFRLLRLDASPARALAELAIPIDSPLFAGHFPGQPVLPGIAHLALVQHVLAELAGGAGGLPAESAIVEVRNLRLRQLVAPGDRLALSLETESAGGLVHFDLRRPMGELVSKGIVRCGSSGLPELPGSQATAPRAATAAEATTLRRLRAAAALPPPARLLPHASPARLLTAVLSADAGGIECTAAVPADHPLVASGCIPGFAALELGAQAAAALQALLRPGNEPGRPRIRPRIGYLVGARAASCAFPMLVGRGLHVTAIPAGSAAQLALYEIEVREEGATGPVIATGTLSTFLVES